MPEDAEDIKATARFVHIVRDLLATGASVDCVDAWGHASQDADLTGTETVDLSKVGPRGFRFFENYRFVFSLGA
jgi:hypothetical protein